jgi:uncharacterized protein YciI
MTYFLYKLLPPRPDFDRTMSEREQVAMREHIRYWTDLTDKGKAVVFGPIADPAGVWGLAVVAAESEGEVHRLGDADPVVNAGVARYAVYAMPRAVVAGAAQALDSAKTT